MLAVGIDRRNVKTVKVCRRRKVRREVNEPDPGYLGQHGSMGFFVLLLVTLLVDCDWGLGDRTCSCADVCDAEMSVFVCFDFWVQMVSDQVGGPEMLIVQPASCRGSLTTESRV